MAHDEDGTPKEEQGAQEAMGQAAGASVPPVQLRPVEASPVDKPAAKRKGSG